MIWEVSERYRTVVRRLAAGSIDSALAQILVGVVVIRSTTGGGVDVSWLPWIGLVPFVHSIVGHRLFGRTVGKWIAGVAVIDTGEERGLGLVQCLVRDLVPLVFVAAFGVLAVRELAAGPDPFGHFAGYAFLLRYMSWMWLAAEIVTLLWSARRRAIHDWMARSVVVRHRGPLRDALVPP